MLRNLFVALISVLVIFGTGKLSFAQHDHLEHGTEPVVGDAVSKEAVNVGNKICPVSGDKIIEETKSTFEYKSKVYNLCCPVCIDEFKKDPDKYIKKVNEELQAQSKEEVKQKEIKSESGMPMTNHEMHH